MRTKPKSDALKELHDELIGNNAAHRTEYQETLVNMEAGQLIYDMRTSAGLSQRELAKRIGTTASAICRLEQADYTGHTLAILNRIAAALGRKIELRAVPREAA
ncbi:MAG: helix-turn-helix transcriptional regulator [Bryobacteraceae bacterium]|jgi:ribosome-binding protein aMBF1 (putative translation factor)